MPIRGCGQRIAGGIYFECNLSPDGLPLEHFLYCPPPPVPEEWNLSPISTRLIGEHVVDWIGESHYPNVLDYLEEVRRFGLSGRMPENFPFARLSPKSRFMPVHRRAIIDNWQEMRLNFRRGMREPACPRAEHSADEGYCSGYWWEDVVGGEPNADATWRWTRAVQRTRPAFSYIANASPPNFVPQYRAGILGAFPLTRLVVVRGDGAERRALRLSRVAPSIPVALVEE